MTEDGTTDAPQDDAQPTPLVGHDGTLSEGWREQLPEDIRGEKVFDRVKNFEGAMRSLASAERMVGMDKIVRPKEDSGDDVWAEFYKAGGMPESPDGYGLAKPEDFPDELYSEERATEAMGLFHKLGLNGKQAKGLFDWYNGNVAKEAGEMNSAQELEMEGLKASLLNEWGNAYEAKVHLGNVAIEQASGGDAEYKERLVAAVNSNPDLIKAFASLGESFQESSGAPVKVDVSASPEAIDSEIAELMADATFNEAWTNKTHPNHKAAMAKLQGLYKKKNETKVA